MAALPLRCPVAFSKAELGYTVRVYEAEGASLLIDVDLESPLPVAVEGQARFNLEIFPGAYFGKTFELNEPYHLHPAGVPRNAAAPGCKGAIG